MHVVTENNKSIGQVVSELKNDARDFVSTRLQILTQEMNDKLKVWKAAIPILVVGALLGGMALIVLTFAVVAFLAGIFLPSPYAWCYGALIVTAFYMICAFGLVIWIRLHRNLYARVERSLWLKRAALCCGSGSLCRFLTSYSCIFSTSAALEFSQRYSDF